MILSYKVNLLAIADGRIKIVSIAHIVLRRISTSLKEKDKLGFLVDTGILILELCGSKRWQYHPSNGIRSTGAVDHEIHRIASVVII